jgi:hypothetical protein
MKTENQAINETIKRTKRYWYVDGFSEIGVGILLMVIILFNYAVEQMQQSTLQVILLVIGMPALIILGTRALSRIVVKLKEKYTYPRTGYVSYLRKPSNRRWSRVLLTGILGFSVGAVTSFLSGKLPPVYEQIFVSLVITLVYVYIGYSIGLKRFYILAAACLVLLGIAILLDTQGMDFFLLFFLGQGLVWIVSGILVLHKYLKTTQPPLKGEA